MEGFSTKSLISIDLNQASSEVIDTIYAGNEALVLNFEGKQYYRSPKWGIVSKEELVQSLKEFCLSYICKRHGFLVSEIIGDVVYLLGNSDKVNISLFGVECGISYDMVARKEVVC